MDHQFHHQRPEGHPGRQRQLPGDGNERGGAAHLRRLDLGIGDGVDAGELQRAEEAADQQHRHHHRHRRRLGEGGAGGEEGRAHHAIHHQDGAEAEAAQDGRRRRLHAHGADRRGEGDEAGAERRHAEAELQHQRQQERQRADAEPEHEAAGDAGAEGRQPEQREVDDRRGRALGVHHIGGDEDRAAGDQRRHRRPGQEVEPQHRQAEGHPGDADPGEQHADKVEALQVRGAEILDVAGGERDADEADRQVDEEDPVPGGVGRDEAADRRPQHRPDQRRHRHPGHGVDQVALGHAAHQHRAADRRHHGAAHALHDAGDDEVGQRARQRAADRAEHEHRDGGAEHGAGAEAVGGPAARRDEDRQRQEIRGDGELERQRVGADVASRSPAARWRSPSSPCSP